MVHLFLQKKTDKVPTHFAEQGKKRSFREWTVTNRSPCGAGKSDKLETFFPGHAPLGRLHRFVSDFK
jgi:hypothetical protein